MKKIVFGSLIFLFTISFNQTFSQDMFKEKRERKRVWRKHRTSKDAYNPYLKKKAKDKPSAKVNSGNKREERRQKRAFKKQLKRNKKKLNN
ncbi:MAG: hypothetical protein H0U95_17110 [Bacteroidetes bacterium]|nr:hypothetical protein [Bacteroidota bacterium]